MVGYIGVVLCGKLTNLFIAIVGYQIHSWHNAASVCTNGSANDIEVGMQTLTTSFTAISDWSTCAQNVII